MAKLESFSKAEPQQDEQFKPPWERTVDDEQENGLLSALVLGALFLLVTLAPGARTQ